MRSRVKGWAVRVLRRPAHQIKKGKSVFKMNRFALLILEEIKMHAANKNVCGVFNYYFLCESLC